CSDPAFVGRSPSKPAGLKPDTSYALSGGRGGVGGERSRPLAAALKDPRVHARPGGGQLNDPNVADRRLRASVNWGSSPEGWGDYFTRSYWRLAASINAPRSTSSGFPLLISEYR